MAEPITHPDFDLDTALSADLDGELDAYASELGLPVGDVRAALTTPAAGMRRGELAAARDALRDDAAAPPLDDLTRRRLLTGAGVGTAGPSPRRNAGRFLRPAAAAAITLLVLGGLYAIVHDSGGSDGSAAKSGAGSSTSAAAVRGDLGSVGTIDAARVAGLLQGTVGHDAAKQAPVADEAQRGNGAAFSAATPGTVDGCADQYASEGTIRFRGSGTYQGQPAVVLGIDTSDRTIVFVVAAANCTQVLYSASR